MSAWHITKRVFLILLLMAAGLLGTLFVIKDKIMLGAEAYLYGYPLVIMDITRTQSAIDIGPENELRRVRKFPDANFKDVVRPNVDTLYTTAFISMKKGPWVFEMPAQSERYELMPFMDAWTNVFASPGTRTRQGTQKNNASVYLLVGPHWQGQVPAHMTLLRSPTDMVWLIGRTQTNGSADFETVHRIQDGLRLVALNAPDNQPIANTAPALSSSHALPPVAQIKALSTHSFFDRLMQLMVDNPPAPQDQPLVQRMAQVGLKPGQAANLSWPDGLSFSLGRWLAHLKIKSVLNHKDSEGTWRTPPLNLGQYGTDYNTRAVVAMVGLGANLPEDALYPNTASDHQGKVLNGKHTYQIHFEAQQLPPVKAFWSITAYGADEFLIDNPLHRYALGDRDPLHYNADGSLDIWIQAEPPKDKQRISNWLPVKADRPFLLNARLYWPKEEALKQTWQMPPVVRLD